MTKARAVEGSSPLTRGKLPGENDARAGAGLIPAHAGKTSIVLHVHRSQTAHPRSRGENIRAGIALSLLRGSSPLTRGKPAPRATLASRARLIPAHAGKTVYGWETLSIVQAHPRSRGENPCPLSRRGRPHGSSPLTRGKLDRVHALLLRYRLIPAHAGKTPRPHAHPTTGRAHPRSRGENRQLAPVGKSRRGSSPLTRGKPPLYSTFTARRRLIPAHAGKTMNDALASVKGTAHPRSRGENYTRARRTRPTGGSSPLTRGKPHEAWTKALQARLIPAHAGKTS